MWLHIKYNTTQFPQRHCSKCCSILRTPIHNQDTQRKTINQKRSMQQCHPKKIILIILVHIKLYSTSTKTTQVITLCCFSAGASTPYKRWSKCTMKKIGGEGFCRNLAYLGGEVRKLFMHFASHQVSDFKAKMQQIRFRLGLRPRPHWGS